MTDTSSSTPTRTCPKCGTPHEEGQTVCLRCGETLFGAPAPRRSEGEVVIREYKGKRADATRLFQRDAKMLAAQGYVPTSQSYVVGQYRGVDFLAALLLCLVLVGFLIFIYMVVVKPAGTLTVVYERREASQAPSPVLVQPQGIEERLAKLDALRSSGSITVAEYEAKRAQLISEL